MEQCLLAPGNWKHWGMDDGFVGKFQWFSSVRDHFLSVSVSSNQLFGCFNEHKKNTERKMFGRVENSSGKVQWGLVRKVMGFDSNRATRVPIIRPVMNNSCWELHERMNRRRFARQVCTLFYCLCGRRSVSSIQKPPEGHVMGTHRRYKKTLVTRFSSIIHQKLLSEKRKVTRFFPVETLCVPSLIIWLRVENNNTKCTYTK